MEKAGNIGTNEEVGGWVSGTIKGERWRCDDQERQSLRKKIR